MMKENGGLPSILIISMIFFSKKKNNNYGPYLVLLSPIDVFRTLNLSVFIESTVCYKCLSWSMDFRALSIMYYTKGRKLSCYTCYGDYILLNSYMFFSRCVLQCVTL